MAVPKEYLENEDRIVPILENAHNEDVCKIRHEFYNDEHLFFREHINNKNVLVLGSGLGHDSFELAKYNKNVVGVEYFESLASKAKENKKQMVAQNLEFMEEDFFNYTPDFKFDVSVLNMGTIGNFADIESVIIKALELSEVFYFDFYKTDKEALEKRKDMYQEEGWSKLYIEGVCIRSKDGLKSCSIPKSYFDKIASKNNLSIDFFDLNSYSIMTKVWEDVSW